MVRQKGSSAWPQGQLQVSPYTGHTLLIEARGIQDGGVRVTFDVNDICEVNALAGVLLAGSFKKYPAIG